LSSIDVARLKDGDEVYRKDLRFRSQIDLFFLAKEVLGYDLITERTHRRVAEFFVQKDPRRPLPEWDSIKKRLWLFPRGTFKSTFNIADSVQYILCDPNVRILDLTASGGLADAIVDETGGHFVLKNPDEPTVLQRLFPEYCITPKAKRTGIFTAPNRLRDWREGTIMSNSIDSSLSGWHFDVEKDDDTVDNRNSATPTQIKKVKKNLYLNGKMLMPWGYRDRVGTRYDPFDAYGEEIEKAKPGKVKVLIEGALKMKDGSRLEEGQEFPGPDEMVLLFPELLSYEFLRGEYENDYSSFMTQYMNDAYGDREVVFAREMMLQASIEPEKIPVAGEVHICWRIGYSSKEKMRFSGGAAGIIANGRLFVVDLARGAFKPSVLAHRIVVMAKKYGSHQVSIEDTPGARQYESAIQNYALTMTWRLTINWIEYQEDDGTRELRIKATEPLLATKRLLLSLSLPQINDCYRQFVNFGMVDETEVPDVVSRLAERLPKSIEVKDLPAEQEEVWEEIRRQDLFDRIHGAGRYAPVAPIEEEKPHVVTNSYPGEDIFGGGLNG